MPNPRQQDDLRIGNGFTSPFEQMKAILIRQVDVANHGVKGILLHPIHRFLTRCRGLGAVSESTQVVRHGFQKWAIVVDDE